VSRTAFAAWLRGVFNSILRPVWRLAGHPALLELLVITLLGGLYITHFAPTPQFVALRNIDPQPLLNILLNPEMRQTGLEHERLAGVLIPAEIGLKEYGYIPAWNPYMGMGEPLINNAFSYLFNPFYSLPVLLLGAVEGSKLAMILAVFIAGYSMWALARAIGLGAVGRVTTGALYMMSGGIAAKFYQGHFQLGLSLAWVPLALAGLWWTLRTPDRRTPLLMAAAFALLFFSGNIYYTLHTLISMAVITLLHLWDRHPDSGSWRFRKDRLRRVLVGGGFAFGLAALQFIPVWAVRDFVDHAVQNFDANGHLVGNYSLAQATANFIYPWPKWMLFEQPNVGLNAVVDYAYIGPAVFALILTGIVTGLAGHMAAAQRYSRALIAGLALALIMMVWGAGQTPVLIWLYAHIPLLEEFRFVGRALTIAALWWIVLAGIGTDLLWRFATNLAPEAVRHDRWRLLAALGMAAGGWGYFFVYSLAGQTTRLNMVFYNFRWLNTLDAIRFTSFSQATETLWLLLLAATGADTALRLAWRGMRAVRRRAANLWRAAAGQLIRASVLGLAIAALADLMPVNSQLFTFQRSLGDYDQLYAFTQQAEPDAPFPAINLPFTPLAYDAYYARVRNWGLNEGWTPEALPGALTSGHIIPQLPRWAVVIADDVFGASGAFSLRFVETYGYELRECQPMPNFPTGQPCAPGTPAAALLYENPAALPYAFVATADQLRDAPEALTRQTVHAATVLTHTLDTITIRATAPDENQTEGISPLPAYYLIVEENHFPGWEASTGTKPVQTVTIQTQNVPTEPTKGLIGIPLLPGTHTYTLRFQPPGFTLGLFVFISTLVAQAIYLLYPRLRRQS
jgi:hypothetical protein